MSVTEHKNQLVQVNVMVLTISDTRTITNDKSGQQMIALLEQNGHRVVGYEIVKDEQSFIEQAIRKGCDNAQIQAVLINGGTGVAKRDVTFDLLQTLIEKPIPGFGELFRMLSYEEIGSAAMLSRATAGITQQTVIFSTPGSTNAVTLAMEKLILPELSHIMHELHK
ncbi:MAG: MogA/MoaB family molybdenum cofactor biosynthesis protein [Lysinibacillus sp.]